MASIRRRCVWRADRRADCAALRPRNGRLDGLAARAGVVHVATHRAYHGDVGAQPCPDRRHGERNSSVHRPRRAQSGNRRRREGVDCRFDFHDGVLRPAAGALRCQSSPDRGDGLFLRHRGHDGHLPNCAFCSASHRLSTPPRRTHCCNSSRCWTNSAKPGWRPS